MSRLTTPQIIIFSLTFLVLSLIANVVFFLDQTSLTSEAARLSSEVEVLTSQIETQESFKSDQLNKLEAMGGQQTELADIISLLQTQIGDLNREYQQTVDTARLTQAQLAKAQATIAELGSQLETTSVALTEANITIRNQQRALRSSAQTSTGQYTEVATTLSSILTPLFTDISVTETTNGQAVINIPLTHLFNDATLSFSENAAFILEPIARELASLVDANFTVIGHSDSRPIVSEALKQQFPTNWELSTARASKVVSFLINNGVAAEQLTAAGRASIRPVREADTPTAWAINRRIEIRLQ